MPGDAHRAKRSEEAAVLRRPERLGLLLGALAVTAALLWIAARRALWYDELFTWYVCGLESPRALLRALLDGADNGPPADYLLRFASMRLFGDSVWAFRLPSVFSFVAACLCIHRVVRSWAGALAAGFAALVPCATAILAYGSEGRAYVPFFASTAVALWAWQRAARSGRATDWLLLALTLWLSPLFHYYGVLSYLPPLAGESVRALRARRFDPMAWAAICAPAFGALLVIPFARNAMEMRAAFWAGDFDLGTAFACYAALLGIGLWPLLAFALAGASWSWRELGEQRAAFAATAACALLPFALYLLALLAIGAMTERYAVGMIAGIAIFAGWGVQWLRERVAILAALAFAGLVVGAGLQLFDVAVSATAPALEPGFVEFVEQAEAPIVFDSPHRYLESRERLPAALRSRIHYLIDRERSRGFLGFDNDEISLGNLRSIVPLDIEPYDAFVAEHREFLLLVDSHPYWLLAQLEALGASLETMPKSGRFEVLRCRLDG